MIKERNFKRRERNRYYSGLNVRNMGGRPLKTPNSELLNVIILVKYMGRLI